MYAATQNSKNKNRKPQLKSTVLKYLTLGSA